jgi:hypothetical protein
MKSVARKLDEPWRAGDRIIHTGAEAQLEGLAQVSQMFCVESSFGTDESLAFYSQHVFPLPLYGPYRTIEILTGVLGCTKQVGDVVWGNHGLAAAIFVAALCGRFYGSPSELTAPRDRVLRIVDELGPNCGRFDMPDEEAAELVDKVSRRLWGRTALEEISEDIDAMEGRLSQARDAAPWIPEELFATWADFIAMRRRFLRAVKQSGPTSLLPRAFPDLWRDRLHPWHVAATPGGGREDQEGSIAFGRTLNPPFDRMLQPKIVWGTLHAKTADSSGGWLGPSDPTAWTEMLKRYGPLALLMLNGRRHRRMVPPELEGLIEELEEWGLEVRFDPHYEWPEQRDQATRTAEAVELAAVTGRRTFICDMTGDQIDPTQAAVLTPWEFRRTPLVEKLRQDGSYSEVLLLTDWSDWIVRRDLLG